MKDWYIILATLLGPLFAIQVSQFLERRRQKREERLQVFKTLMATRAARLDPRHVEALNQIDVVFHGTSKTDTGIRNAWKQYLDHLADKAYPKETWAARQIELLVELLYSMAKTLGYDFDKTHIKNQAYFPEGYGEMETDQIAIRKTLVDILNGRKSFPVTVTNLTQAQKKDT